jgi:ubiquinone/menaquinone biosynthesis C-methylase UbiE
MNRIHNLLCSSRWWKRRVKDKLVPWGLEGVQLGDDVLEIGPGFGATTRLLAPVAPRLTVVELESRYCRRLREELGDEVEVVQGDATELPFEDNRFSTVLCFTMLHHIPEAKLQDRAFAEIARVLEPGGTFAGTDSVGTGALFQLIHVGERLLLLDPKQLPARLRSAGLGDAEVQRRGGSFRFRARNPDPVAGGGGAARADAR